MSEYRVVLDYGHGGEKAGAVYAGVQEKTVNLQLGNRIYDALHGLAQSNNSTRVILTRDSDEHIPLSIRYKLINQYHRSHPVNLVVSVHFNAAPSVPSANGFEVYYLEGSNNGTAAAKAIVEHVQQNGFKIRGRGYKTTASLGRNLAMIHKTHPPAVLIEEGFLSNDQDRANSIDATWQDSLAHAIAAGTWHYMASAAA